ncbi:MAG: T9SS type A sorting domain-containing protein, partial [Chitinophagales bacterium]
GTPVFLKVTDEAILTSIEVLPTAIFEAKLFPNIFRNHTFLQIELKEKSSVHIEVFDLQGRIVQELLPIQSMNRGIYQLEFEGMEWKSGVYFCGIEVGGERKFLKMVKL